MSEDGGGTLGGKETTAGGPGQLELEVVRPRLKNTLHSNGHTCLEYDSSSHTLISSNHTDPEIYLFQVDKLEEDCSSSEHFGRREFGDDPSITVMFVKIAPNNKHALVALSNFRVELYTYPAWERDGLLVRFDSPPTCARLNWDESFVAIGSQEGTLKVVEMESPHRFKIFEGHSGPILDVQYDPSEDYLVSSSCDGTVRVWNSGNRKCLKLLPGCVPVSNDLDNCRSMARCAWQPRVGNLLAVPAEKKVIFFDRRLSSFLDSPRFHFHLPACLNQQDFVSMVCWHPGSSSEDNSSVTVKDERSVMALVTVSSDVILAEFNGHQSSANQNSQATSAAPVTALRCIQGKQNKVTSFVWMPNSFNFVVADEIGMVYFYTGCVPENNQKKDPNSATNAPKLLMNETVKGADEILNEMATAAAGGGGDVISGVTSFEDGEEDGSISLDQIKQSYVMQVERGPDANAQDDLEGGDSQGMPLDAATRAEGAISSTATASSVGPPVEVISYQAPLQPASSPVNLSVRYMKWNLVGIVRRDEGLQDDALSEEEQSASITVEFHDSTFHHSLHIKDEHGYTLADLSEEALVLAAPASTTASSDGAQSVSVVTCNTFSFWDHSNQWSSQLPAGERALALCISSQSWLAVATSQSLLRLFSVSGIQLSVVMLPGHLTSIAAGGVNELLHVFQPSQTLQRDKFYSASVYSVTGFHATLTLTQQFPLCQADDNVTWAGYSEEGDAAVAFSSGPLYLLKKSGAGANASGSSGHCWMPVFNARHQLSSKTDRLWIVGVAGSQLRVVYCKASKFPAQLPKPILLTYPLGLPLCNVESEQSQLESQLQTQRLFQGSLSDQQVQSAFLKLFALACRTDRDCRAVDICNLMPNEETVILAIKYATKLKKLTLANKLAAIAHQKSIAAGREDEKEEMGGGGFAADVHDENSRSLFNSQQSSQQQPFSYSLEETGATESSSSNGVNDQSPLLAAAASSNPILRRTMSSSSNHKLSSLARSCSTDLTDGGGSPMEALAKRRVNPFLRDDSSSSASNKLDCSGSSVFDSLQLLKPDKLRSKSSSSDLKALGRKKSSLASNSQQKNTSSSKSSFENQENCADSCATAAKVTPFQAYFQQAKADLQEQNPSLNAEDLLSVAMKSWKKLSADEKAQFSTPSSASSLKRRKSTTSEQQEQDDDVITSSNNDVTSETTVLSKKSKFDSSALLQQFSFS